MSHSSSATPGANSGSSHIPEGKGAATPISHRRLVYLHGFRSSPASFKARLLGAWFEAHRLGNCFICPSIPVAPGEAIRILDQTLRLTAQDVLVGSSLGGLYATCLAERHGCRAVLLNPAVHPSRDLARFVGTVQAWHTDAHFSWRAEDLEALRELESIPLGDPGRYLLIAATGDEVIDWRLMASRYAGCHQIIVEGSNHALDGFEDLLEQVIRFAQFAPSSRGAPSQFADGWHTRG